MKKGIRKEFVIGLITLVSLFVLYFGIKYLKGINIFKPTNHYYVAMSNVAELQPSSPVYIDGYKVGVVNHIEFLYGSNSPKDIRVQINLNKQVKLQEGTYAELKASLTSGAYLNLILNKYTNDYYQIGDTFDGVSDVGLMDKLQADLIPQVEKILPRLDSILLGIQTLVNHPALTQSLDHVEATTANLQHSSAQLNTLLAQQVPPILSNLKQVSTDFAVVSNNLKGIDLQPTLKKLDVAAGNIDAMTTQLNSRDNSLGLLLHDKALYNHLDSTAANASALMFDIKANPKRYVHFSVF
ncbi:MAG: MlaD family protein [Candidatus Symbiothrix sp.]|jgi:phospholipid/cholesterol/gamma-HCH transport system substrate-binding protein|nr:MlaD family protein [Candidatus Symbiothrix sp.]